MILCIYVLLLLLRKTFSFVHLPQVNIQKLLQQNSGEEEGDTLQADEDCEDELHSSHSIQEDSGSHSLSQTAPPSPTKLLGITQDEDKLNSLLRSANQLNILCTKVGQSALSPSCRPGCHWNLFSAHVSVIFSWPGNHECCEKRYLHVWQIYNEISYFYLLADALRSYYILCNTFVFFFWIFH